MGKKQTQSVEPMPPPTTKGTLARIDNDNDIDIYNDNDHFLFAFEFAICIPTSFRFGVVQRSLLCLATAKLTDTFEK